MPEAFFQKLDTDNRGSLSAAEMAARHGKGLSRMDTNGDGRVDTFEAEAMAAKRFAHMDKNADGVLTADEMKARRGGKGRHHKGQSCEGSSKNG